ncbi:MAG: ribosome biogenesis/translation initiation ATPase RLI [Euryarchaeota archaeon]|nr:ribosome biogenesis/translation initiation ATPase RLI [Euryarchaeota archaeon]
MRLAVILRDRCNPNQCSYECINFCPVYRNNEDIFSLDSKGKPIISEGLCIGCGICVHKCPLDAIRIINIADDMREDIIHQYGPNAFRLFRLPSIHKNSVVGLLGANGVGKTTVVNIFSGKIIPNFGDLDSKPSWDKVLERFAGTALYSYFKDLADGRIRTVVKPQYVDLIPKYYKGTVKELLERADELGKLDIIIDEFGLKELLDRTLTKLSGGELQLITIAATFLKDADFYFFDEPSSYLDIVKRLFVARKIRELSERANVFVVEHDLAVLDFLADIVYILYGEPGAFGVVSNPRHVRNAINAFLLGYLDSENVRIRDYEITFEVRPPKTQEESGELLLEFRDIRVSFESGFTLEAPGGTLYRGEIVGVVGPNAIGKTTLVRVLAGEIKPESGTVTVEAKISYKPQYVKIEESETVEDYFLKVLGTEYTSGFFQNEILHPLGLKKLLHKDVSNLSGGETQLVAIAACLGKPADIYLLDEPSAYLDASQRMEVSKVIKRIIEKRKASGLVVDHDIYFIDMISDSLLVFSGEPSIYGKANGPYDLHRGMNEFLKNVGITFRRDPDTGRPRVNKPGSKLDREQKMKGEYYYVV